MPLGYAFTVLSVALATLIVLIPPGRSRLPAKASFWCGVVLNELALLAIYLRADAPPFLLVHGDLDPSSPVAAVRAFAERLGEVSTRPVHYLELPGGQHAFDLFHSPRGEAVVDVVEAFATSLRQPSRARPELPKEEPEKAPGGDAFGHFRKPQHLDRLPGWLRLVARPGLVRVRGEEVVSEGGAPPLVEPGTAGRAHPGGRKHPDRVQPGLVHVSEIVYCVEGFARVGRVEAVSGDGVVQAAQRDGANAGVQHRPVENVHRTGRHRLVLIALADQSVPLGRAGGEDVAHRFGHSATVRPSISRLSR
jgi:hypothetical protein